ncbi:nucleoside phosphatase GDA1/CD39 [Neoconidiobolus thromboides FSU 785]|nr:nucleoside phosphatase GDA1/CD39 [Neoconidiobolus thromboides FSU 785]
MQQAHFNNLNQHFELPILSHTRHNEQYYRPIPTTIDELQDFLPKTNNYEWVKKGHSLKHTRTKNKEDKDLYYGIIMDAGSTGTRIFIYEWNKPTDCHDSPYIVPSIYDSGPKKGKQFKIKKLGGLAEIEPEQVDEYLKDFIGNATEYIPKSKHARTPIFLKATAGMRLLPRTRSHQLMENVRNTLKNSGFKFDPKFGAQVIPGEYEGVFGWLAINYLAGILGSDDEPDLSHGMLDMGGASCQITFETPQVPMENSFPINLNGTSRVVYTHSYLRFGRNEARLRYHANEIKSLDKGGIFKDPCFVKGYRGKTGQGVDFEGSGDFTNCVISTRKLMLKDPFCPTMSCAVNGVYQPDIPKDMKLIAISGMFKVAKWFKCKGKSNIRCLMEKADSVCSNLNYDEYLNKYDKWSDDKDIDHYCFMAAYIVNMLNEGYGLALDRDIYFDEEVEGIDVGWTLGAMIYEVNLMFPSGQCCHPSG